MKRKNRFPRKGIVITLSLSFLVSLIVAFIYTREYIGEDFRYNYVNVFCINGIYYCIDGESAIVIRCPGDFHEYSGNIVVPEKIVVNSRFYKVESISKGAFSNNNLITSVELPSNIEYLPKYCFAYCTSLLSVRLPEKLKIIPEYLFCDCYNLKDISIPDSVKEIMSTNAFENCKSLKKLFIPKNIEAIWGDNSDGLGSCVNLQRIDVDKRNLKFYSKNGILYRYDNDVDKSLYYDTHLLCCPPAYLKSRIDIYEQIAVCSYAFQNCKNIKIVNFRTKGFLRSEAFKDCIGLQRITLPKEYTCIRDGCFENCSNLICVITNKPDKIREIWSHAFKGCKNLSVISGLRLDSCVDKHLDDITARVDLCCDDSLRYIGSEAFSYCSKIRKFDIPQSVIRIDSYAFADCTSLEAINLPDSIDYISHGILENCTSLKFLHFPDNLKEIGTDAFQNCTSLERIDLPYKTQIIGFAAFRGCVALKTITIPSSVQVLDRYIFAGCDSIMRINSFVGVPLNIDETVFDDFYTGFSWLKEFPELWVDPDRIESYKHSPIWNDFIIYGYHNYGREDLIPKFFETNGELFCERYDYNERFTYHSPEEIVSRRWW